MKLRKPTELKGDLVLLFLTLLAIAVVMAL
jgi:hypothetical protein